MNRHGLSLAIIAAASVIACAAVDQRPTEGQAKPEKVYTTGSRIPVHDRSAGSADVKSTDNRGAGEILDNRGVIVPGKGGPVQ